MLYSQLCSHGFADLTNGDATNSPTFGIDNRRIDHVHRRVTISSATCSGMIGVRRTSLTFKDA